MQQPLKTTKLPIVQTFTQVLHVMKQRYLYFLNYSLPILVVIGITFLFSQNQIILTILGGLFYLISLVIGIGVISLSYAYLKNNSDPTIEI